MMPICDSYVFKAVQELKIAAIQGVGIVCLGNFSGMVAGLALSPPPSINVSKVIGSSLFGGFIGMAIALSLILRKTREFTNHESN